MPVSFALSKGLPTARKDHAEVMVRFARMCLQKNRGEYSMLTALAWCVVFDRNPYNGMPDNRIVGAIGKSARARNSRTWNANWVS